MQEKSHTGLMSNDDRINFWVNFHFDSFSFCSVFIVSSLFPCVRMEWCLASCRFCCSKSLLTLRSSWVWPLEESLEKPLKRSATSISGPFAPDVHSNSRTDVTNYLGAANARTHETWNLWMLQYVSLLRVLYTKLIWLAFFWLILGRKSALL